jgi:3,4-dihydroxy 2-butanone 4-phosphate synthase/GTP cyclohydrolase II
MAGARRFHEEIDVPHFAGRGLVLLAGAPNYRKVRRRRRGARVLKARVRSGSTADVVGQVLDDLGDAARERAVRGRPFVTLAWAQSLDGSIALEAGQWCALSGPESLSLTHAVRAAHDAILVGIGTLLADDPRLSVRHWSGRSPDPVVLDSRLRTPPTARVLAAGPGRSVRIACTAAADEARAEPLARLGARVLRLPAEENGWVDLPALLDSLGASGVRRLMVEGGARVLTSFLRAGLGDYAVVTVVPRLLGGLSVVGALDRARPPRLASCATHRLGDDVVLAGPLGWEGA